MANVYFVHWDQEEIETMMAPLVEEGHEVRCQWDTKSIDRWGTYRPDVIVISLERLPSHGRSIAEWILEAKSRRDIPIVFAGGKPQKVEMTRQKFPTAVYVPMASLYDKVSEIFRN